MKTHCLHCNGRQATGNTGTGRIDHIQRVKSDLAWVVWKCSKCNLIWSTPIMSPDDAGTAIALSALAENTPQGVIDEQIAKRLASWQNDVLRPMTDQVRARGPLGNECPCGLPKNLCTIDGHGPSYGEGRVT